LQPARSYCASYSPTPYGTGPTTFREVGPFNRFDHHRPERLDADGRDRGRGILYAAWEFVCCAGEYFGDHGAITLDGNRAARLGVTHDGVPPVWWTASD